MSFFQVAEFKVGLLVLGAALLIGYMTVGVTKDPSYLGRSDHYWFTVDNAAGLIKNSSIKMAGINVGVIKDISLKEGRARVDLSLDKNVYVTQSAEVEIRAQGILGDRYVEIVIKDSSAPKLPSDSEIKIVSDKGSLDAMMNQVGNLTSSIGEIAETLKDALTGDGDNKSPLGRIVLNLENLTADLSEITGEKKDRIKEVIDNLHDVTGEIKALIQDPSEEGFKASFAKLNRGIARVDEITKNFEDISDKLNSGQGTLGKLINDDSTVEELNTAIAGVNEFMGSAKKLETNLDFHTEYLSGPGAAKTYIGARIIPGQDRFYELQVIDDPKGVVERTLTDSSQHGYDDEVKTYKNKVKFTALFAKNFYDFTIKAGLMENSGGAGFEYNIIPKRLKFSFDAFDFAADRPHLRTGLRYSIIHGIYMVAGADDFINRDKDEISGYLGVGLDLNNDDLKMILSKLSF